MNLDDQNRHHAPYSGDVEEIMALVNSHQRTLYRYILTLLPNASDAEDVLQETNLILWRKFKDYQKGANFYAWACQIAYYRVLKFRDKNARQTGVLSDAVISKLAEAKSEANQEDARRDALLLCIDKLSAADRDLINRRYTELASGKSLSVDLGRPLNSIYKSLGRIRRALLSCILRTLAADKFPEDTS